SRQSAPTYRARRRADVVMHTPRYQYQDDSVLGLHMPPLRIEVPVLADPNAPKLAIIGDSLGEALAFGFEGDANIKSAYRLIERTRSSSGLVRDDYFDWPKTLSGLLAEHNDLAAVVIMIGLNDRQGLRAGDITHEPLSDVWREEYRKRIDALLTIARDARVPLIWVGLPIMRAPKLSSELASINAMMRDRVSVFGQHFVEIADAFADASGAFSATGPDVIGDNVRLRGSDGIHFTPAGQRKLAFFVDRPLRRITGERNAPALASLSQPANLSIATPQSPVAPATPSPTAFTSPAIVLRNAVQLGPVRAPIGEQRALGETRQAGSLLNAGAPAYGDVTNRNLFDRGLAPDARPGRADDHIWR
ncbi:MAG: SGNH/GDSL hydrolase family protein, partial [Rhabdaerophilum sp.]